MTRKFGYWVGSPEENAAVGIRLHEVTGSGSPARLSRSRGPVPGRPLGEGPMFVIVSLLLAAACLLPAAGKLLGHPKMRQSAARFGIRLVRPEILNVPNGLGLCGPAGCDVRPARRPGRRPTA